MARRLRGIASDGTKYVVHYDREWREWQVRAYRKNNKGVWKFVEEPTYYANDKEDATQTFWHLVGHAPAGTHVNPPKGYRMQAQGYGPGPYFNTKAEAIKAIRKFVAEDVKACRRQFGAAFVENWDNKVWEVRPVRYRGPGYIMWSRYSLHDIW